MASVTWPPLVTAAPSSSSVKVARARPGTATAMRPMRVARMGGTVTRDIGCSRRGGGSSPSTAVIGRLRHARRPGPSQTHPRLPVRPGRARAGALPRQWLQPGRPALRRTAGAPAADRRGRRCRRALPLAPWWLGASGRLWSGRHAARPRPRTPQRRSVLHGTSPDLPLSGGTPPANAQPQAPFPVNFSISLICIILFALVYMIVIISSFTAEYILHSPNTNVLLTRIGALIVRIVAVLAWHLSAVS